MDMYDKIDILLNEKNMKKTQLAELTDIPYSSLTSAFSRHSKSFSLDYVKKIADALNVSLYEIMGWDYFDSKIDLEQLSQQANTLKQIETACGKEVAESLSKYFSMELEHRKEIDKYIEYIFDTNGYYEKLHGEGE